MEAFAIGWIFGLLIWGLVWGYATQAVINNKGYEESWFIWGFLFGFIALIVACTKPQNTQPKAELFLESEEKVFFCTKCHQTFWLAYGEKKTCPECSGYMVETKYTRDAWRKLPEFERDNLRSQMISGKNLEAPVVKNTVSSAPAASVSAADEIRKYKELLDMGAITQEEFDQKKKQLLNL